MSGPVELAGLALAVFPLVISLLEHYQDGYEVLGDWIFFRREYSRLVNDLKQEQLLFKQHIEGLLRSVSDSEFNLKLMMTNLNCNGWQSAELSLKVKRKLSGDDEYETYVSSLQIIHEGLDKMAKRLDSCKPPVCLLYQKRNPQPKLKINRTKQPMEHLSQGFNYRNDFASSSLHCERRNGKDRSLK